MCRIKNCDRYEYDRTLCLKHLKEAVESGVSYAEATHWEPKDTRKKHEDRKVVVDSVELVTADETDEMETRNEE